MNTKCPECGGRLVAHIGNGRVVVVHCLNDSRHAFFEGSEIYREAAEKYDPKNFEFPKKLDKNK